MAQFVERKTLDRRVASSRLFAGRVNVLCNLSKNLYPLPSHLFNPGRRDRPDMTEKMLTWM